jgi:ATP-dependent Clp protease ATP-binding subunit ClpC
MGARPLRRAIQRYIEDPLADEVLKASEMAPGATVEVNRAETPEGEEPEVSITIRQPERREAVTVGGDGEAEAEAGGDAPSVPEGGGGDSLPEEPEVLPEAPDAPPSDEPGPPSES